MSLELCPCTITEAKRLVGKWHRHTRPPVSGLFAVACRHAGGEVALMPSAHK
jgi:hypothetical protein